MKQLLLILLLPLGSMAQQPAKQLKFSPSNQDYFKGKESVSPDGKKLLVTFWKDKITTFELIDLVSMKLMASGNFPARVSAFAWNKESGLVAVDFIGLPPQCFDARNGMKKVFSAREAGTVTFSGSSLLGASQPEMLYVFGYDYFYRYNLAGKLVDSVEMEENDFYSLSWYSLLGKTYCCINNIGDEIIVFSDKGEKLKAYTIESMVMRTTEQVDKDGTLYLYGDDKKLNVFNVHSGKNVFTINRNKIYAAAFTPDSRGIILKTPDGFEKIDIETKHSATVSATGYYNHIRPTLYGTELVAINPGAVDVYTCKDYLPQMTTQTTPVAKNDPAPVTQPVVAPIVKNDPPVIPVATKRTLPYRITDFITPFAKDSFYLHSSDKSLHYCIVYSKKEGGVLWSNPYSYIQYFGFKSELKFSQASIYTLDMTDSTARMATYAKSGLIEKPMMIGGQNYLGKLAASEKQDIKWTGDMYGERPSFTAKVIDNTYKGIKAKCLVVSRKEMSNGQPVDESYFYQQGVGLIKIESGGKVAFQRM